ncbi:MAG: thiosulfate oxidation carrier complex protein SoxZ [Betaproteobacteria bacterium]|nr:thiosulfate oxidation carrier complex protein SoxZ [Betaproteobacteria bacterium]
MGSPMKLRAKADGDVVEVKVLMAHIMETGQRKNQAGDLIPAHFIQSVSATHKDKVVLSAQWGPAVSANPWIAFKFKGGVKGEKVKVSWTDNRGDSRSDEVVIA